jgi:hypothetical protein
VKGDTGATGATGGGIAGATVVTASTTGTTATATCPAGRIASGGGGNAGGARTLVGSFPNTNAGGTPVSWTAVFSGAATQTVYVVCVS